MTITFDIYEMIILYEDHITDPYN